MIFVNLRPPTVDSPITPATIRLPVRGRNIRFYDTRILRPQNVVACPNIESKKVTTFLGKETGLSKSSKSKNLPDAEKYFNITLVLKAGLVVYYKITGKIGGKVSRLETTAFSFCLFFFFFDWRSVGDL